MPNWYFGGNLLNFIKRAPARRSWSSCHCGVPPSTRLYPHCFTRPNPPSVALLTFRPNFFFYCSMFPGESALNKKRMSTLPRHSNGHQIALCWSRVTPSLPGISRVQTWTCGEKETCVTLDRAAEPWTPSEDVWHIQLFWGFGAMLHPFRCGSAWEVDSLQSLRNATDLPLNSNPDLSSVVGGRRRKGQKSQGVLTSKADYMF